MPAVFCHTGQRHGFIRRLIREQHCHGLTISDGKAKLSKVRSIMVWWSKCIYIVIYETAGRKIMLRGPRLVRGHLKLNGAQLDDLQVSIEQSDLIYFNPS